MIKCPKCGADNMLNAIFCRSCGEKLNLAELKIENQLEDPEDKSKKLTKLVNQIVGGVLAFLIVLILALVFIPVSGTLTPATPSDEAKALRKALVKASESKVTLSQQDLTDLLNKALNLPRKGEQQLLPQSISVTCQADGTVKIVMKSQAFGFLPLNANVTAKPVIDDKGKFAFADASGIRLGWLPFLPAIATNPFVLPFKNTAEGDNTIKRIRHNLKAITVTEGSLECQVEKKAPKKAKGKDAKGSQPAKAPVVLPF